MTPDVEKITKEGLTNELTHSAEIYLSAMGDKIIKDDDPIGSYCNLAYYVYLDACSRLLVVEPHNPYGMGLREITDMGKMKMGKYTLKDLDT